MATKIELANKKIQKGKFIEKPLHIARKTGRKTIIRIESGDKLVIGNPKIKKQMNYTLIDVEDKEGQSK